MRKVFGIGETVLDIIFRGDNPIGAVPGGSVYNSIISLGRSGVNCTFISETGNDRIGKRIISFLKENNVDPSEVYVHPESKSPLSLAFLDEENKAEYIFYKDHDNDKLDYNYPEIHENDIVLFGSYYAVNPVIRSQMVAFLQHAKKNGAILYYDVNFRSSHKEELTKIRPNMLENFELADIIRGSNEDFQNICGINNGDKVFASEIAFYCKKFIYTQGDNPVILYLDKFRKEYPVLDSQIETVSTIGAGDNFNAGVVFSMIKNKVTKEQIAQGTIYEDKWDDMIKYGQMFAACSCKSLNNYVTLDFAAEQRNQLLRNC